MSTQSKRKLGRSSAEADKKLYHSFFQRNVFQLPKGKKK